MDRLEYSPTVADFAERLVLAKVLCAYGTQRSGETALTTDKKIDADDLLAC
jgi:hypothetical protein